MRMLLLPLLLAGCAPAPFGEAAAREAIAVRGMPVALDPADPTRERVGALRWMGGLVLTSPDRRLGGLSGLRWDDGVLLAVSDEGNLFAFTPRENGDRLTGIAAARVRRLTGADGRPLPADKALADIESLELIGRPARAAVVALESDSTIWRHRLVDRLPVGAPEPLLEGAAWRGSQSRTNGGVEAQAIGPGLRLMVSEELREADGSASAYLITGDGEQRLGIPVDAGFKPTDLVLLDARARRFLLLQRNYRPGVGTWTRLARFALERDAAGRWRCGAVETLATFGPPLTADNMEGLALRREGGRSFLYMVSDDNFSAVQRTLLMKWEVVL